MTVKDGFKLGVGIALAFVVVGLVLGFAVGIFDAATSPRAEAVAFTPSPPGLTIASDDTSTWGCGRQCRIKNRREVCVDNPPCPKEAAP